MNKSLTAISIALAAAAVPLTASANLVINGNFESPPILGSTSEYFIPPGGITGWTTIGTNVQLVGSSFLGLAGGPPTPSQWVDLTGGNEGYGKGLVSLAFATVVGQEYTVRFDVGAYGAAGFGNATAGVSVNGSSIGSGTSAAPATSTMNWTTNTLSFFASSTSSTVQFLGAANGALSNDRVIGLDNVVVTAVPEPHEWAMMLAGLGVVGWVARRRRAAEPALAAA